MDLATLLEPGGWGGREDRGQGLACVGREFSIQEGDVVGSRADRCPPGALWQYGERWSKGLGENEGEPASGGQEEQARFPEEGV